MTKAPHGTCHLCGLHGKLTFEHVPPESAFNDTRVLRITFDELLNASDLDNLRGKQQQRGAGGYTLCGLCNNSTGLWYVPAYTSWAKQAMEYMLRVHSQPTLALPYNIYPLRVLKQIICMFFSVNGPAMQSVQPDLVRFVLNKYITGLPPRVRVFVFYSLSSRHRSAGYTAMMTGLGTPHSKTHAFTEITFAPFGFVMTLDGSEAPQAGFCEITSFSKFSFGDWIIGLSMPIPMMSIYSGFPGDYRTRDRVIADQLESIAYEARMRNGAP